MEATVEAKRAETSRFGGQGGNPLARNRKQNNAARRHERRAAKSQPNFQFIHCGPSRVSLLAVSQGVLPLGIVWAGSDFYQYAARLQRLQSCKSRPLGKADMPGDGRSRKRTTSTEQGDDPLIGLVHTRFSDPGD